MRRSTGRTALLRASYARRCHGEIAVALADDTHKFIDVYTAVMNAEIKVLRAHVEELLVQVAEREARREAERESEVCDYGVIQALTDEIISLLNQVFRRLVECFQLLCALWNEWEKRGDELLHAAYIQSAEMLFGHSSANKQAAEHALERVNMRRDTLVIELEQGITRKDGEIAGQALKEDKKEADKLWSDRRKLVEEKERVSVTLGSTAKSLLRFVGKMQGRLQCAALQLRLLDALRGAALAWVQKAIAAARAKAVDMAMTAYEFVEKLLATVSKELLRAHVRLLTAKSSVHEIYERLRIARELQENDERLLRLLREACVLQEAEEQRIAMLTHMYKDALRRWHDEVVALLPKRDKGAVPVLEMEVTPQLRAPRLHARLCGEERLPLPGGGTDDARNHPAHLMTVLRGPLSRWSRHAEECRRVP